MCRSVCLPADGTYAFEERKKFIQNFYNRRHIINEIEKVKNQREREENRFFFVILSKKSRERIVKNCRQPLSISTFIVCAHWKLNEIEGKEETKTFMRAEFKRMFFFFVSIHIRESILFNFILCFSVCVVFSPFIVYGIEFKNRWKWLQLLENCTEIADQTKS